MSAALIYPFDQFQDKVEQAGREETFFLLIWREVNGPELGKRRGGQERGISQRGMDLRTVNFIKLGHLHVVKEPVESEAGKQSRMGMSALGG